MSHIANKKLAQISLAQAATGYTEVFDCRRITGQMAILLTIGGAGTVTVTQQGSIDGKTWYSPVDADANADDEVANSVTVGTTFRPFSLKIARYVRFKCVEANVGTATVDIEVIFQE